MCRARPLAALALFLLAASLPAQEQDLRERYGTQNLEAARNIHQSLQLDRERKYKEALAAIEQAIKADRACALAHYRKAHILASLGDIEESIAAYKVCLSDQVRYARLIAADAAVNMGLIYLKLKETDEANLWLTRGIVEDWDNGLKLRGKAYRNLAISLRGQGKHLAAAVAVAYAFEDRAPNCDVRMVRDFFDKAEGQEAARVLHFADPVPALAPRSQPTRLDAVSVDGFTDPVSDLLTDPRGRYVIALSRGAAFFHRIATGDRPAVHKVPLAKPVLCGCLVQGSLYLAADGPARIEKVNVETGNVEATYSLQGPAPSSLAVFPIQRRAYYAADQRVQEVDLQTGSVRATSIPGQVVAGHPSQRYLFSYVKPDRRGGEGARIIIQGRRLYFNRAFDWLQSTLFKSVVTPGGLLLAEVRDNAASNASRMAVSPEGNRVALAGGGGWRPGTRGVAGGYGTAVFAAGNLEQMQGFFACGAYPQGVCFNPVTGQTAVVRGDDASVYAPGSSAASVVKGPFNGAGAWSGNGRYLVLAAGSGGVTVFSNALSPAEEKAADWWKAIRLVAVRAPRVATASFQSVEELAAFSPAAPPREELARELARAVDRGRTDRPARWQQYGPYQKDEAVRQALAAAVPLVERKDDLGIAIFQLRKGLKAQPDSPPLQLYLAEAQRLNGQEEQAEPGYVAVVKADRGRTSLTVLALKRLAALQEGKKEEPAALHCLALALYVDRGDPKALSLILPLLKKLHFSAEAVKVERLAASVSAKDTGADLPRLPRPGQAKKLTSGEVYRSAVGSVVVIKTGKGSGSGVCVGRPDIILTNDHVVAGAGAIEVYPFVLKDKSPVRMPALRATVIYQSEREDVAVLKLEKAVEHLAALPVATASPDPGEKVYAVGSPGLGEEVLEQSISEGLVSSRKRLLEGVPYLQHSAAVNPGNSGGPLLDEYGRVVGIVTLKARLENVGFAIPVETVRRIFQSP